MRAELLRWLGPGLVVLAGLAMLWWTWRAWPDPLIDFGRELYVPWRLAAGQVLYRDVAYFDGPLSPYWNSLWFRLFGSSLMTLIVSNVLLLAVLTALCYRLCSEIGSRAGAATACVIFVALFAFGQFLSIGNYNFIAPYSHDLTHGVLLSVAALFCLYRYQQRQRLTWIAAAGAAVGLLYLTKVEVLLAGGTATVVGIGLTLWMERPSARRLRKTVGVFLAGVATPIAVTLVLLWLAMPLSHVLRDALGHWLGPARAGATSLPFYREGLGLDDPAANAAALFRATFWYAVMLGPPLALALALRGPRTRRLAVALGAFVVAVVIIGANWRDIAWQHAARPLPFLMLILLASSLVSLARVIRRREIDYQLVLRLSMSLFALGLLGKMVLNTRIQHYGFALAMPATLLLVLSLVDWLPALVDALGGHGAVFRAGAAAALCVATLAHLTTTGALIASHDVRIGSGADAFWGDARGRFVNKAIEELRFRARPDRTLAVFPEGVMINYLDRRVNPTPYTTFIPLELALYGEDRIASALEAHPPDYVMLVHRDTSEYGMPYFGRDYGRKIYAWIRTNYRPITLIGAMPFHDGRFGILLMQRNERG